jgi:hypothetical protein
MFWEFTLLPSLGDWFVVVLAYFYWFSFFYSGSGEDKIYNILNAEPPFKSICQYNEYELFENEVEPTTKTFCVLTTPRQCAVFLFLF